MLCVVVLLSFWRAVSPTEETHEVECGPVDTACECDAGASICKFQFYVEDVFTFTRYNTSIPHAQGQGQQGYIDEEGNFVSNRIRKCAEGKIMKRSSDSGDIYCIQTDDGEVCVDKSRLCTDPITVDGRTFKTVLAVNKQFPGPTLIVHEGQVVAVDVHNNLSTESISVHWHGLHQMNSNYMDGVGLVTQCPILPGASFRYIFKAKPSGTFWYHSHIGAQRANGLFGAIVVKEKELSYLLEFVDDPASHTMTLMDWTQEDFDEFILKFLFSVGVYLDLPPFTVPSPPAARRRSTDGPDFAEIGNIPFGSGLINGKGRHSSVPYERSSLTIFEVEEDSTYRFRLIHTGLQYAFWFSIEGHKLIVMATDGYVVQPVTVDYIAIHSGERYDFLVEADQTGGDYWINANTFEINIPESTAPPYMFHENYAEAILHYTGMESPHPSNYSDIQRIQRQCTQENPCKMLNCPFGEFHPSYNIECISVDSLRLVTPTPEDEMPNEDPDVTYFMNMAAFVSGKQPISSINDKNFLFPQYPLTTHYERNEESSFCAVESQCEIESGCQCTTVMDLEFNKTVRVVLSAIGIEKNGAHPMHIHGHSAHVLKVGYGEYSKETGAIIASSRDLTCSDVNDFDTLDMNRCPNPRFRSPDTNFPIDRETVRKDTIIVPSGGYVVFQFRSDNPGFWLFHCHLELHQHEGMVLIVREAVDRLNYPPEEMETCNTFMMDIDTFLEALEGSDDSSGMTTNILVYLYICNVIIAMTFV